MHKTYRVAPTNHSSSQKTRLNDLSYGIKSGQIFLPFCQNACICRQTDGQTEFSSPDRICTPCSAVTKSAKFCTFCATLLILHKMANLCTLAISVQNSARTESHNSEISSSNNIHPYHRENYHSSDITWRGR